jgi:hypothetical protein
MKQIAAIILFLFCSDLLAQKPSFLQKANTIEVFDFQEITIKVNPKGISNPFTDVKIDAEFVNGTEKTQVKGFCDAQDGSLYRVRFMPQSTGVFNYQIELELSGRLFVYKNKFTATGSARKGPIEVDTEYPTHFIYRGSKEHYFWNGATAYWLLGWKDEKVINQAIDRLANYGINRMRVAINGRAHGGSRWNENNVIESDNFTFKLNPWVAQFPNDLDNPQFDVTRFQVSHWQKLDRAILRAREKGIIISLIFFVDGLDHGCDPFKKENMGNVDEQRYYAYAAARYGAYENIMWDIANEYHLFRTVEWADKMGPFLKQQDAGRHMISVHGSSDFPFRKSPWVDCVLYQSWDECGGYDFMTNQHRLQAATGRLIPQINEEYGYEGHYSVWGCGAVATKEKNFREGLYRSQLAWEMYMTGSYQTTGETAEYGTGAGTDTGGGWINGRGNNKMNMLKYYQIIKNIFEQVPYWKMKPDIQSVNTGNLCLSIPHEVYLLYTRLHYARISLKKGDLYSVKMINPRTGEETLLPDTNTPDSSWQYPKELEEPMVFLLKRLND